MKRNRHSRTGFTLVDLGVVVLMLAAVTALAGPTMRGVWGSRMAAGSASNLHALGTFSAMYSASSGDRIPTYSWRGPKGDEHSVVYVLPDGAERRARNGQDAASIQNRSILMEMTGRITPQTTFRDYRARIPHRRFVHLPLWQFMGPTASTKLFVDPADTNMLNWHSDPLNFSAGSTVPYANGSPPDGFDSDGFWSQVAQRQRWAFAPSYYTVPAAWLGQGERVQHRPLDYSMNLFISNPNLSNETRFPMHQGNKLGSVAFPSAKVYMHEEYDRRQGPVPTHYAYDFAAPMKLMFDGSINTQISGEAGSSYDPVDDIAWRQRYIPLDTYPLPFGGAEDPTPLDLRYRWTRHGLFGVDYTP